MKRERGGDDIFALLKDNISRIEALVHDNTGSMRRTSHSKPYTSTSDDYDDKKKSTLTVHAPIQLLSPCTTRDDRFRFNIGNGHERTDHESNVYHTTLGRPCVYGGGVAFTFPPPRLLEDKYSDEEPNPRRSSVSTFSSVSATSTSEVHDINMAVTTACVTPQRRTAKGVDTMAAEALCGLLELAAPAATKRKTTATPYLVSP